MICSNKRNLFRSIYRNLSTATANCNFYNLGTVEYLKAWEYQRSLVEYHFHLKKLEKSFLDSLIITEHPSIYTLGKGSTLSNLKYSIDSDCYKSIIRVERGGEVTWHGPGMIMIYPIIDLSRHQKSLRWYVNALEEVIIKVLIQLGISAQRSSINNGVWVGKNKV